MGWDWVCGVRIVHIWVMTCLAYRGGGGGGLGLLMSGSPYSFHMGGWVWGRGELRIFISGL